MPNQHQEDEEFFEASPIEDEERFRAVDSSAATIAGRAKLYELLQQHAVDDATDVFYDVSEKAESSDCAPETKEGNSKIDRLPEKLFRDIKGMNIADDANIKNITINGKSGDNAENQESFMDDDCVECDIERFTVTNNSININMDTNTCHNINSENKNECVLNSELITKNETSNDSLINSSSDAILQTSDAIDNNREASCLPNESDLGFNSDFNSSVQNKNNSLDDKYYNTVKTSNLETGENNLNESLNCDSETVFASPVKITEEKASPTNSNFPPTNNELDGIKDSPKLKAFEENRPMITRSTSLKTGKTPPGTPSRKKIVRFADVLGLDLEDVRTIISGDIPTIPQSAYSDLQLDEEDQPLSQTSSTIEIRDRQQGSWENIRTAIGPNTLYPMFPIPGQQIDFWDRVRSQGICLESATVSDSSVQCICRVMNWGFHKRVCVRYSSNNWLTTSDIDASYVSGSSQNNSDSFTFNIFLPISCRNVEFALRYEINGKEYWDNNNGKNYRFSCHSNTSSMQGPSSPTFVHQFW